VNAPVKLRKCASLGCELPSIGYPKQHARDDLRAVFCFACWRCIRSAVLRRGRTREEEAERLRTKGPRTYEVRCSWCDRMASAREMDRVPREGAHECRPGDPLGCATTNGARR
jgi:hypothetical protein